MEENGQNESPPLWQMITKHPGDKIRPVLLQKLANMNFHIITVLLGYPFELAQSSPIHPQKR